MTDGELKIYEAVMKLREEVATYKTTQDGLKETVKEHDGHIETMQADRNKALGITWAGGILGGLGFFTWLGQVIFNAFVHKQ